MNYTVTVEIDVPRARVVELFDNPDLYPKWQECLVSLERLEGDPGQVGTRTRLRHQMGRRKYEMVETVTVRDLPDVFTATYEADGVWNEAVNRFTEREGGGTRWTIETEFHCKGFMRVMAFLMPGMFKKETQKVMNAFKVFAEGAEAA